MLKIVAAEDIPYANTYLLKAENALTLDGESYDNIFNVEPQIKLKNYAYELFMSGISVKTNGVNADFTEGLSDYTLTADFINESGGDVSKITLLAVVIRNNVIYKYDETDIFTVPNGKFSDSCVFEKYEPQTGDLIKVSAFDSSGRMIANSGYSILI